MIQLVVFAVGDLRCALPVSAVREILPAATVVPLPGAPALISGALDLRGAVLPVVSMRRKLGLPHRPMQVTDVLIVTTNPALILHADRIDGVVDAQDDIAPWREGVARDTGGLMLIQDLAGFLSSGAQDDVRALLAKLAAPLASVAVPF